MAFITLYDPGPALNHNAAGAGPSNFNFPDADVFSHPSEQFRSALCPDPDHFYEVAKELAAQIPSEKIHTGLNQFSDENPDPLIFSKVLDSGVFRDVRSRYIFFQEVFLCNRSQ